MPRTMPRTIFLTIAAMLILSVAIGYEIIWSQNVQPKLRELAYRHFAEGIGITPEGRIYARYRQSEETYLRGRDISITFNGTTTVVLTDPWEEPPKRWYYEGTVPLSALGVASDSLHNCLVTISGSGAPTTEIRAKVGLIGDSDYGLYVLNLVERY